MKPNLLADDIMSPFAVFLTKEVRLGLENMIMYYRLDSSLKSDNRQGKNAEHYQCARETNFTYSGRSTWNDEILVQHTLLLGPS